MKAEEIAQWVIDNRYPKSENDRISDLEMYNEIVDSIKVANADLTDTNPCKNCGQRCKDVSSYPMCENCIVG